MGVRLSPLVKSRKISLSTLSNKIIAFDANNLLYQFLALVRMPDGTLFKDHRGRITSHLLGASLRITRLMIDYQIKPILIFDGTPNILKLKVLEERRVQRAKALKEWEEEIRRGNLRKAFSKAVVSATLSKDLVNDSVDMFKLMGLPVIFAPEDAEAQAAYMCERNMVWAVATQDYDALLYGSPKIVRYVTIQGTDFLPSKKIVKPLEPELISLDETLKALDLTREQLVDVAILVGTDFNKGVKGVGPRKAYNLIKIYGSIENIPPEKINGQIEYVNEIREIFLSPKITKEYSISFEKPQIDKLIEFYRDRNFSENNIEKIVERLTRFYTDLERPKLSEWL
ncbi:MAG: flap endonuclease-1 [Nitrososphaeria archaeon]|nr:flap endonuclease-1 [Nitrososphaeria archaeon]